MKIENVFTICNISYLNQAIVALRSISSFVQVNKMTILLVDIKEEFTIGNIKIIPLSYILDFAKTQVDPEKLEILNHYTVTSLCTAIKPFMLLFLKNNSSANKCNIYIDPDTYWISKPNFEISRGRLIFFRHRDELYRNDGFNGTNFLTFGGMNLGLIVDTGADMKIIKHWAIFSLPINYESAMNGYYTDQRPADMLVLSNRAISHYDSTLNLSYWNINDVRITKEQSNKKQVYQGLLSAELSMFHFSGFRRRLQEYKSDRRLQYVNHPDSLVIQEIHDDYYTDLKLVEKELEKHELIKLNVEANSAAAIFTYLLGKKADKGIFAASIFFLVSNNKFFARLFSRFYMMKNPLGI